MLSELHSLTLKLCSKHNKKKMFTPDCGAAVAGDITTEPKQGRRAGPMSSLCILLCLWIRQQVILMKQIGDFFQAYSSASMV